MSADSFTVEKGIPIPTHRNAEYPWHTLEIGDSFFVPGGSYSALTSLCSYNGKASGRKFTARVDGDGVRVWRVA